MRRQDKSDIEMRAPHVVEVPYTAGKPVRFCASTVLDIRLVFTQTSYRARRKKSTTQSTSPLSQQPPPAATASTFSADTSTPGTMEAPLRPHVTITGWCARLVGWFYCVPIHINGEP
ncbi:hypothetical protein BDR06DRAFT_1010700 [Suillus hirtellus]|nr:hypothetical protein BDR06DRAFT_1010700 [Suillus hirtellus]